MSYSIPNKNRCSIRLKDYDYSQCGAYFITICTDKRKCVLGDVVDNHVELSKNGIIVLECINWLKNQYPYIEIDATIIMPNHIHSIIVIKDSRGGSRTAPTGKRKSLGSLIGAFKTVSTKRINIIRKSKGVNFWQRNYYEHVLRNEKELFDIREYILSNPIRWEIDRENPVCFEEE
ncbi:MAG: transposase [bacterium]|nr:transposase [bacterium]